VLLALYGVGLIAAGVFRADSALGFPPGAPPGPPEVSWHDALHFVAGAISFVCLAAACFSIGRRYAAEGRRSWALYSRVTGVVFLAGFAMVASGQGGAASVLAFTSAVVCVWAWMSSVAHERRRRLGDGRA
jgi:hypothetical protein